MAAAATDWCLIQKGQDSISRGTEILASGRCFAAWRVKLIADEGRV
jgi:hypothetical protein